jgi:hypothetical protein
LVINLSKGRPTKLGTLILANTAVAFNVPEFTRDYQGILVIQTTGAQGTTPTLEASLDGAATWFLVPIKTTFAITGQLTGDTAATFAAAYDVSGMGAGAQFKFGYAGAGVPIAVVWALVG